MAASLTTPLPTPLIAPVGKCGPPPFKYPTMNPELLARDCGIHLILDKVGIAESRPRPLSVPIEYLEEFERFCKTPSTVPLNPDFDPRQLGISPDQLHDFIPPIQLVPIDVIRFMTTRLAQEGVAIHPPFLYGGALRHLFTKKPLKDLDPLTFLQRNELQTPFNVFIDMIIHALRSTKHRLNLEGKNIRAFIKCLYLFDCHRIPRVMSCINLGVINWKFIAPELMTHDHRFHLCSSDRIFMDFFGRELFYFNRKKICVPDEHIKSLDDLRSCHFVEDLPETIIGLAGRRLYASLCGLRVFDTAEIDARRNFLNEYKSREVLVRKLQTLFHYKFQNDPHGAFLLFIKHLKFMEFIPDETKRQDFWRGCAQAWIEKPIRPMEIPKEMSSIEDFRCLVKEVEERKDAGLKAEVTSALVKDRGRQRNYLSFGNLILNHPQLTPQALDLINGLFIYQWLRNDPSISFEFSLNGWQLCWSRGQFPYYLTMPTFDKAFCSTFKAWKALLPFQKDVQDFIHDLNFSGITFSETGLQTFVDFFLNAMNVSTNVSLVRQMYFHSRATENVLALREELLDYYSAYKIEKWHLQANLLEQSGDLFPLYPYIAGLFALLANNLSQYNPNLLLRAVRQLDDFIKTPSIHSDLPKTCHPLLYRAWHLLIDQSMPEPYEASKFKIFQELCLLPLPEFLGIDDRESASKKLVDAYREAGRGGNLQELAHLYTRLRQHFPRTPGISKESLRVQVESIHKEFPFLYDTASRILSLILNLVHHQFLKNFEESRRSLSIENEKMYVYFLHEAALFLNDAESCELIKRMLMNLFRLPPKSNPYDTAELVTYAMEIIENSSVVSFDMKLLESHVNSLLNSRSHVILDVGIKAGLNLLAKLDLGIGYFNILMITLLKLPYTPYSNEWIGKILRVAIKKHEEDAEYLTQIYSLNASENYTKLLEKFCLFNKNDPGFVFDFLNQLVDNLDIIILSSIKLKFIEALLSDKSTIHLFEMTRTWESLPFFSDDSHYFRIGCQLAKMLVESEEDKILPSVISKIRNLFRLSHTSLLEELIKVLQNKQTHKHYRHIDSLKALLPRQKPILIPPVPEKKSDYPSVLAPLSSSLVVRSSPLSLESAENKITKQLDLFLEELKTKQHPHTDNIDEFMDRCFYPLEEILSSSTLSARYDEILRIFPSIFVQHASKISTKKILEILGIIMKRDKVDLCASIWSALTYDQKINNRVAFRMIQFILFAKADIKMSVKPYWRFFRESNPKLSVMQAKSSQLIEKLTKSQDLILIEFAQMIFIESRGGAVPKDNALLIANAFSHCREYDPDHLDSIRKLQPFVEFLDLLKLISVDDNRDHMNIVVVLEKLKMPAAANPLLDKKIRSISVGKNLLGKKLVSLKQVQKLEAEAERRLNAKRVNGFIVQTVDAVGRCLTTTSIRQGATAVRLFGPIKGQILKFAIKGIALGLGIMIASSIFKRGISGHLGDLVLFTLVIAVVTTSIDVFANIISPASMMHIPVMESVSMIGYSAISREHDPMAAILSCFGYFLVTRTQDRG